MIIFLHKYFACFQLFIFSKQTFNLLSRYKYLTFISVLLRLKSAYKMNKMSEHFEKGKTNYLS